MTLWLLTSVWSLLLLGGLLAPRLGSEAALIGSYAACVALVLASRPRPRPALSLTGAGLAGAAGFAALPAWLALVWLLGLGLGLARPELPHTSPSGASASAWLAHVVLAPLFEELLYRERLLPSLRKRTGAPLALVLSSAAFAAPHLEPWIVLTTFCAGLALGGIFLVSRRVELCVAYHAGLNGAVLVCGLPPVRAALPPLEGALVAGVLLGLACGWTRGSGARPRVHAEAGASVGHVLTGHDACTAARPCPRSASGS